MIGPIVGMIVLGILALGATIVGIILLFPQSDDYNPNAVHRCAMCGRREENCDCLEC
jgi:hypothetical protein